MPFTQATCLGLIPLVTFYPFALVKSVTHFEFTAEFDLPSDWPDGAAAAETADLPSAAVTAAEMQL